MSIYGQGHKTFDYWRNFVLLDEIPAIEAIHMPWMCTLWMQAFVVLILLIVGILKLYFEAKKLNSESIESARQNIAQSNEDDSHRTWYISGLYNVVLDYYQTKHEVDMVGHIRKKLNLITRSILLYFKRWDK